MILFKASFNNQCPHSYFNTHVKVIVEAKLSTTIYTTCQVKGGMTNNTTLSCTMTITENNYSSRNNVLNMIILFANLHI